MSGKYYVLFTFICLLFFGSIVAAVDGDAKNATALHIEKLEELRNTRNCRALCEHCGCLGFYCGEECICECNHNDNSDTECITTMQSNARQLEIPFEILIQGPSTNSFLRNARPFADALKGLESCDTTANGIVPGRKRRSTLVIYKPSSMDMQNTPKTQDAESTIERSRRSVGNQMDWFTDLAHNLVRPAPLRRTTPKPVEKLLNADLAKLTKHKPELDRSWFTDNTQALVVPAPIFKRQSMLKRQRQVQKQSSNSGVKKSEGDSISEEAEDDINELGLGSAIRKTSKAIKETWQTLQDNSAITNTGEDSSHSTKNLDLDQILPRPAQGSSGLKLHESKLKDYFGKTLEQFRSFGARNEAVEITTQSSKLNYKYAMPWLRNRWRFAQRKTKFNLDD